MEIKKNIPNNTITRKLVDLDINIQTYTFRICRNIYCFL